MAGWHSLSGYLYYKPGGPLGKLKGRKKLWYEYDNTKQQLIYYKTQENAANERDALGNIDIKSAAITLSLTDNNQFIILSGGREHILTAENHESMMIWLLGLQAKRDICAQKAAEEGNVLAIPASYGTHKKRTQFTHRWLTDLNSSAGHQSEPIQTERQALSEMFRRSSLQTNSDLQRHQRLFRKLGESVDAGLDHYKEGKDGLFGLAISRDIDCRLSSGSSGNNSVLRQPSLSQISEPDSDEEGAGHPGSLGSIEGWSGNEEVFHEESDGLSSSMGLGGSCDSRRLRPLRRIYSDITDAKVQALHEDPIRDRSNSGQSASSDSALERGSECELEKRLTEMEQELISAKCELAKMKNRETCYKTILEKRDSLILELDGKVEQLQEVQRTDKGQTGKRAERRMREQTRILQNQNRFLNEEVKKLARLLQNERQKFKEQDNKHHALHAEIEKWKRDYVLVLQSSITVPTGDLTDGMQVSLYGGNRHRLRIQALLDEARCVNPGLPSLERLLRTDIHIDNYGFKHSHSSEGLVLHHACHLLQHFYTTQLSKYDEHQRRWKEVFTKAKISLIGTKELKMLCRQGIPSQYRSEMWKQLVLQQIRHIKEERGSHYYSNLVSNAHESECAGRYRKQISLDLLRTMPTNVNFNMMSSQGVSKLQEVLAAFCSHSPHIGYCQGMNFITAMFLLFMDVEDTFWSLVAITEFYFAANYFDQYLSGAQADQEVLGHIMKEKLPNLAAHLDSLDIEISTVTLNWFLAIFFDALPFETLLRVWDCFLLEGPKVLFRFALAILKIHEPSLLKKGDTISIMRHLKSCAALTFDVDGLIQVAFEGLKPFPRRQNIASKQAVYLKTLKEKLKKQEMVRKAFEEKENKLRELDLQIDNNNNLMFECAVCIDEGTLWVSYGNQNSGLVCSVNCEQGLLYSLDLELDSRIMCMCVLHGIVLMGTLGQNVHAFSIQSKEELWSLHMHDAVLAMCCREDQGYNLVFAALADGTIAVLENVDDTDPLNDPLYIPIGRNPVTAVMLLDSQLWCACGNVIFILHAETLDTMDRFVTSSNPFDHILLLLASDSGVWIATKGSSIVELWDPTQLICKMLYDVKLNKHPTLKREDDCSLNLARVTTLLPLRGQIWVGTGDGNLIMFDIVTKHGSVKDMTLLEVPEHQHALKGHHKQSVELERKTSYRRVRRERSAERQGRETAVARRGSQESSESTDTAPNTDSLKPGQPRSPKRSSSSDDHARPRMCKSPVRQRREEALARAEREHSSKKAHLEGRVEKTFKLRHFPGDDNAIAECRHTEENKNHEKYTSLAECRHIEEKPFDAKSDTTAQCKEKSNTRAQSHLENKEEKVYESKLTVSLQTDQGLSKQCRAETAEKEEEVKSTERPEPVEECSTVAVTREVSDMQGPGESRSILKGTDAQTTATKKSGSKEASSSSESSSTEDSSSDSSESSEDSVESSDSSSTAQTQVSKPSSKMGTAEEVHTAHHAHLLTDERTPSSGTHIQSINNSPETSTVNGVFDVTCIPCAIDGSLTTSNTTGDSGSMEQLPDTTNQHVSTSSLQAPLEDKLRKEACEGSIENPLNSVAVDYEYNSSNSSNSSARPSVLYTVAEVHNTDGAPNEGIATEHQECQLPNLNHIHARLEGSRRGRHLLRSNKSPTSRSQSSGEHSTADDEACDNTDTSGSSRATLENRSGGSTVEDGVEDTPLDVHKVLTQMLRKVQQKQPLPPAESQVMGETLRVLVQQQDRQMTNSLMERRASLAGRRPSREALGNRRSSQAGRLEGVANGPRPEAIKALCSSPGSGGEQLPPGASTSDAAAQKPRAERQSSSPSPVEESQTASRKSMVHIQVQTDLAKPPLPLVKSAPGWSSYEEINPTELQVTPSSTENSHLRKVSHQRTPSNGSSVSLPSEVPYVCELSLQAKIKISGKPVRCLLHARTSEEPVIISCAGCYGEDEAVLKWRKELEEKLWTNEPVFEVCPETRMPKTPMYLNMRQMSSSSLKSLGSTESLKNFMGGSRRQSLASSRSLPFDLGTSMSALWP